jgi:hypothetical protein
MGTDRNRKRLKKAEGVLMPREIVASWIEEFAKFASFSDYLAWTADELMVCPRMPVRS